jgi:Flp pilus assembly pilin Flp
LGKALESTAKKKKKADKEAKRGVMGFDEVNILADPTQASADTGGATGGGGGGGGGGGAMAPPDAGLPLQGGDPMGFEKIRKKAMELGATLRTMWEPIGKALKTAWEFVWSYIQIKFAGLRKFWKENGKQILEAWNNVWGFLLPILKWVGKFIWKSIKGLIDGVIKFFEGLLKFFAGVFTGDWGKAWEGIKDMVVGIFEIVLNWMNLSFVGGIRKLLLGGVKKFITIMSDLGKGMKGKWDEIWTGIKTGIGGKVQEVIAILKGKFDDMVATIYIVGDDILKGLVGGFKDIGGWFKTNVIDVIASTFTKYKGIISTKFEEVWTDFKSFWSGIYNWVRDNIIYKIRDSFVAYKTKITDKAKDIWTGITEKLSGAYTWVRDNIVYKIRDSFVAYKTKITDKAKDIMDGIKDKFTGIGTWFHKKVITPIQDAWTNIKTGFSGGFKSGVVAILNQGIKLINWWLGKFNTVLDLISKVVPGTIPHVKKIPEVKLAQGGITNGPVRALIGEAGREVVSPLDDLKSMISTAVMSAINFSGGGGTGGDIILNLDGRQFARIVKPHIDRENKRLGINVKLNPI